MVKRKAPVVNTKLQQVSVSQDAYVPESTTVVSEPPLEEVKEEPKKPVFRNPNYQHLASSGGKKTWKNLKQIVTHEKNLPWPEGSVHYSSITAPPSKLPPKKYSDISGLVGKYRDPETKLYYASSMEFATIRTLPSDIVAGYLTLRRANNPIA